MSDLVEGPSVKKAEVVSEEFYCPTHGRLHNPIWINYLKNEHNEEGGSVNCSHVYCPACYCEHLDSVVASGGMKRVIKKIVTR